MLFSRMLTTSSRLLTLFILSRYLLTVKLNNLAAVGQEVGCPDMPLPLPRRVLAVNNNTMNFYLYNAPT